MLKSLLAFGAVTLAATGVQAQSVDSTAMVFGRQESVLDIVLSPRGERIAYIAPSSGKSTILYVAPASGGHAAKVALTTDGDRGRLSRCFWDTEELLICKVDSLVTSGGETYEISQWIAADAEGSGVEYLSTQTGGNGVVPYSESLIDWMPNHENEVLIARYYSSQGQIGTRLGEGPHGLAVDRVNISTGDSRTVESPRSGAIEYLTDGYGNVRMMGIQVVEGATDQVTGAIQYFYRRKDSREWEPFGSFHFLEGTGFNPYSIDGEHDLVYGLKMHQGRYALFSVALDGSRREELIYADPNADVARVVRTGYRSPIAGVVLETAQHDPVYFEEGVKTLVGTLSNALADQHTGKTPPDIHIIDYSVDGKKLLLWAGSASSPGRYYLYDRTDKRLKELLLSREALEGVALSPVKQVSYRAADGTVISADLILPLDSPGRNLPTLVMPHGGSTERDYGGFDWTAQYFASQGYAVLRPRHRSAARYGQTWFRKGEWSLWRQAIDDVNDAGRWLISQGIADPSKLGIFGWSYGGYVALQVNAADPDLYRAVVAVAPLTATGVREPDPSHRQLTREYRGGEGAELQDRFPSRHAEKFKAPVLLFHGEMDEGISVDHSRLMHARLEDAGKRSELVVYPGLGHLLQDGATREDLLRRSDAFLRKAMAIK